MPARTERITVVPDRNGQPVRIMRFPLWWDRAAFIEKFRDRELDTGNPIDWDLAWLKEEYGDRVCFHSAVNNQQSLPFGTPQQVRDEARRLVDHVGRGGGFILAPSHDMPGDIPAENVAAVVEVIKLFSHVLRYFWFSTSLIPKRHRAYMNSCYWFGVLWDSFRKAKKANQDC